MQSHILIVTFPAQGHINPSLQFAKRLLRIGLQITFATCVSAHHKMAKSLPHLDGLSYATFSDGHDDGFKLDVHKADEYMAEMKRTGSKTVADTITACSDEGRPITCLVHSLLLPWATDVARSFHIPSVLLWIQPATVLNIYYHYFHGYEDVIRTTTKEPSCSVELPGLPLSFTARDLPSFLVSSKDDDAFGSVLTVFQEQIRTLDRETYPKVLVNTFDALEPEALCSMEKLNLIAVGPIIPSAFLDGHDPSDTSVGGDLFQRKGGDYNVWLNSKQEASVIYVSFGSISMLSRRQTEEMARALLDVGRPFLWVMREEGNGTKEEVSCMEELKQVGMIVPWCAQLEVLCNPAVGCFVTHCGWNSTMESIVSGVPMVAFPQWTDQGTNAKLMTEAWRNGVRVAADAEGVVESGEMKRCLEMVMGEEGEEMRTNAKKWKELAREAARDGGSSDKNLRAFVDELVRK